MFEKKLTEMLPNEMPEIDVIVQRTLDRLLNMYAGVTERAIKALFLINGGGLVTLLSYFHGPSFKIKIIFISLILFLVGLILAVALVGIDYYVCKSYLSNYSSNIKNFKSGKIKLIDMQNYTTNSLDVLGKITVRIGCISLVLFIIGCFIGIYCYINFS